MAHELSKTYDPTAVESLRYASWEAADAFRPSDNPGATPFCITIPPPNVTGELHMGHALQHAIHDLILRRKRMQGYAALCVPGTDHAGISTNIKVEQLIRSEGSDRWTVGREGFVVRSRDWTLKYGGAILGQLRALGCSYDWSRLRFTLDEFVETGDSSATWAQGPLYAHSGYARAVLTAFVKFYERGWIYRGERIVNWCPHCRTTLSEMEIEHRDVNSHLWHIRYRAADGGEGLVVATTRPETLLGDTGVAVSPRDERYKALIGTRVRLPILNREILVVADEQVDQEFGTGAVKVTPAHDPNDFEIAGRHPELLPPIPVMDDGGRMSAAAGPFAGLSREDARTAIVKRLEEDGLLVQVTDHSNSVGHHDKCGTVIEPFLKLQWWARCEELAQKAIDAIEADRVRFTPARFREMELDWLGRIRPWCLSRQLYWGHRIPLYYCLECDPGIERSGDGSLHALENARPIPSVDPPGACPRCGSSRLEQDPDVLDTWFSSALWPHATLGWPERTADLERFYPTDLMITGRDILYLWVARMIMTGEEFVGSEPFRDVLVHATVMTEDGKRMSKSLGTGVDPLELVRLYGADATRLGLTSLVTESQDIRFKMQWESGGKKSVGPDDRLARAEQIEQMRNFCSKLWNISRFVLMNLAETDARPVAYGTLNAADLQPADRWILSRLRTAVEEINRSLDDFELGAATWNLYHFVWDEFADWYLEISKPALRDERGPMTRTILATVLEAVLRLAHPFAPFITEEIWQALPGRVDGEVLARASYPSGDELPADPAAEVTLTMVFDVVRAIRNLKAQFKLDRQLVDAVLSAPTGFPSEYVAHLARVRLVEGPLSGAAAALSVGDIRVELSIAGLNLESELQRTAKDIENVEKDLSAVQNRLSSPQFRQKAPPEIIQKQERNLADLEARRTGLHERIALLKSVHGGGA